MNDTICALATATGGALGIIRISGAQALEILSHIFTKDLTTAQPNTIHYGRIADGSEVIDDVLVAVFRAPHSYTGEDAVEISCHGSRYILNKVLSLLVQHGCRMAAPGEFTQRAYLNGKLDLSQAEAVADLIASTNRATHQMAISQLRGRFSSELAQLRDQLLRLTSLLELELDFSDHEDLEFADRTELLTLAQTIDARILRLADSFERGQALKNGIPVAIVGKTNVGKSTLLNQLLGDERAIVSDIHGTTRDTIEDTLEIDGILFRFIDTAGIRQTTDEIEQIGIDRTYQAISRARIVLWLLDAAPTDAEIADMQARCTDKSLILVHNKIDLAGNHISHLSSLTPHLVPISAKHNIGIDTLRDRLSQAAPTLSASDVVVNNARHYDALTRAHAHLHRVLNGLGAAHNYQLSIINYQLPPDLLAEDLRLTLDALAEITGGQITPQETLNSIFQHFCVGK